MRLSTFAKSWIFVALIVPGTAIRADPITWTVSAYAPGAPPVPGIGGMFTYDADTGQMLSWDIHFGIMQDNGDISKGGPGCGQSCGSFGESSSGGDFLFSFAGPRSPISGTPLVTFEFGVPLTDAGGIISLVPGSLDGTGSVFEYINPAGVVGAIFPITFGSLASVPEPASGLYVALPLLALVLAAQAKKKRRFFGAATHD